MCSQKSLKIPGDIKFNLTSKLIQLDIHLKAHTMYRYSTHTYTHTRSHKNITLLGKLKIYTRQITTDSQRKNRKNKKHNVKKFAQKDRPTNKKNNQNRRRTN